MSLSSERTAPAGGGRKHTFRAKPPLLPKYVFVLSLENRSFDHLFGRSGIKGKDAATKAPKSVDGVLDANGNIDARYTNSYEPNASERKRGARPQTYGIPNDDAPFVMPSDPKHEFEHILCQTCGPDACKKLLKEFKAAPSSFKLNTPNDSFYDTVPPPPASQPFFVRYSEQISPGQGGLLRPDFVPDRTDPNNSGFVHSYVRSFSLNSSEKADAVPDVAGVCPDPQDVMRCFDTKKQLPILYQLASKFLICDNFFSSIPGPTGPNRFFMMAGSSAGFDGSPTSGDMTTFSTIGHVPARNGNIFTQLKDAKVPLRIYGDDNFPMAGVMKGVTPWDRYHLHRDVSQSNQPDFSLEAELKRATDAKPFPYNFVWIEPDYDVLSSSILRHPMYSKGNSMHPCSDVRNAEKLVADTYNWIRGNKSVWENCVLFITWDEHGGFYDHVLAPTATAPGDSWTDVRGVSRSVGRTWHFKFDRLGTRVPCLVISPFVESNLIDSRQYDHCSILQTVIDLHNRGAFNKGKTPSIKMHPWTDRIRDAASMIGLFAQEAAKAVKVTLGAPLGPARMAASSGNQASSLNPPSGNTVLFLLSAINLHKAADPSLDVSSLVATLTTDEAVGRYSAQAAAAIDAAQGSTTNQQVA